MILDSRGRPMTRRLGFIGGIEVERRPKGSTLVSLVGCERVWPADAVSDDTAGPSQEHGDAVSDDTVPSQENGEA